MPRRTYKKRKYKKKKYRKKSKLYLPLGGFSDSKIVKLRWCKPVSLDAGTNSYAIQTFNAMGLYRVQDGDLHQPANFDVWMRRYKNYQVLGSKMKAVFTPGGGSIVPGYVGIYVTRDTNTELANLLSNGIDNVAEQKRNVQMRMITSANANPLYLTKGFSPSKVFGIPKNGIKIDDDFLGDITKNPDANAWIQLYSASIGGNNPSRLEFLVTIDFVVRLSGLLQQSPS